MEALICGQAVTWADLQKPKDEILGTPFFHNVLHKLYRQIVERDLCFPEQAWKSVAKGSQDFILRLLQVRPGDRLTADQGLQHPWLRSAGKKDGSFGNEWSSPMMQESRGTPHSPHPLQHPHKVSD